MQPQSEPLHPLAQHLRYPLRILAPLESDDKIIAVAHQHRLASKARLHLALEPHVQCVMQVPQLVERDVETAVKMMLDHMVECLTGGGRIEIRGFGSFTLRLRRARVGRNPRTGAAVSLPARYAPYFKPGMRLRERVDQGLETPNPEEFPDGG